MQANRFWEEFSEQSNELARQFEAGEEMAVFETIDAMLGRYSVDFCFDITGDGEDCHLILSPEGDADEAREIDEFVQHAPLITNWKFFTRRRKSNLPDVRAFLQHLYMVDLFECQFRWRKSNRNFVEILIPPSQEMDQYVMKGFGNTFLWHALGEEFVMENGLQFEVKIFNSHQNEPLMEAFEFVEAILKTQ